MARLVALLALLFSLQASAARNESLLWTLAEPPTATGFWVYWALPGGPFTQVDVGRVPQNELSQFMHTLEVPDQDVYFYVVAYNEAGSSPGSNQICRGVCAPVPPPPPVEPPTPEPIHAEIEGFSLWDAQTDTITYGNFITGHSFDLGCYSIEIRGNKYLQKNKGSIRKYFDGVRGGCEQKYQFGWEDDTGKLNKWDCSTSLNSIGLHTLKAEAYDSANCSGTPQNSMEITFGVGVIPEPSFSLSIAAGGLALIFLRRRRAHQD